MAAKKGKNVSMRGSCGQNDREKSSKCLHEGFKGTKLPFFQSEMSPKTFKRPNPGSLNMK
jgi:hypothetical protein